MSLSLPDHLFDAIAKFLKERSGLAITKEKVYLLENRLTSVAHEHGHQDIIGLITALQTHKLSSQVQEQIIDAMTTNETLFLRDTKPFDALIKTLLPAMGKSPSDTLRIWCAACSTGQEPYSIAMHLKQAGGTYANMPLRIDATDLSETVVTKAKNGIYSQFEVQRGLPVQYLMKFFEKQDNNCWKIKQEVQQAITFGTANLLAPFRPNQYDIIFCRNVLIYFDEAGKKDILSRMTKLVPPGGYVILGSSESIAHLKLAGYETVPDNPGIYKRV